MLNFPDHPDIVWCQRTGYPSWNQPSDIQCQCCGEFIENEIYEDESYHILCLDCLLDLHLVKDRVED